MAATGNGEASRAALLGNVARSHWRQKRKPVTSDLGCVTIVPVGIVEDVLQAAEWVAAALTASGYRADFSPSSLWEVERFFETEAPNGPARPGGLLAERLGSRIFALGSYVGEVVRRHAGGTWS